jgi:tetratricopeptide (TPR) repeat protein
VSGVPKDLPEVGSASGAPRQNPRFVPGVGFSTEDYYVWSRCDGKASFKDIILMVGFGVDKSVEILGSLRRRGAILLPGEVPESVTVSDVDPKNLSADGRRRRPSRSPQEQEKEGRHARYLFDQLDMKIEPLAPDEAAAMAAKNVELSDEQKRRFIAARRAYQGANYYEMLGLSSDVSMRDLKRAYFRLSKELHPDRFYRKELGPFREWASFLFEASTRAFNTLSSPRERRDYDAQLRGFVPRQNAAQTPTDHARELFARACDQEVKGDLSGALKVFAAVVKIDPQAAFLRRAATCALRADELSVAEEYAKKAAELRGDDPSYVRVLADVYRSANKLHEAEQTLLKALGLNSDNDKLMGEITADLNRVRQLMGQGAPGGGRTPREGEKGL